MSQLASKEVIRHLITSLSFKINDISPHLTADMIVQAYGVTYNKMLNMFSETYYATAGLLLFTICTMTYIWVQSKAILKFVTALY